MGTFDVFAIGTVFGFIIGRTCRWPLLRTWLHKQSKKMKWQNRSRFFLRKNIKPRQKAIKPWRNQPKPPWVRREVIRLNALYPKAGCRAIEDLFNRLYADAKGMTVSKSWVYTTWQQHRRDIEMERKRIKQRPALSWAKNLLWQADLTQITDLDEQPQRIFGCVDTGTRACLGLTAIKHKTSLILLQQVLTLCQTYGVPRDIQTDNERCFTSPTFRLGLRWLGIRHITTEVASPWQNGRIERFFGTFKHYVRQVAIPRSAMAANLQIFRQFYNQVRPHANLGGKTPAEAWSGRRHNLMGKGYYINEWDGVLKGVYLPP
jgi:transposase InsO family protein